MIKTKRVVYGKRIITKTAHAYPISEQEKQLSEINQSAIPGIDFDRVLQYYFRFGVVFYIINRKVRIGIF